METEKPRALLIAAYLNPKQKAECEEHLDELAELAHTYGAITLDKIACLIRKIETSTYLTSGKLEELVSMAHTLAANIIIFDEEISPSQQRNLEKLFQIRVMDRTELILEVFAARAKTKEACLQIELAQVRYQAPRLKRLWSHLSRQQASAGGGAGRGGGYLKGEGEKQIEIDRRILKRKIDQLQAEIQEVRHHRQLQRSARERSEIPTFAIIGYTNAGKSTLMNTLTHSDVLVENKLFATLDTTTRKFVLPSNQEVLVIDTVGFIRKLPHLLIAAFKSTLEESLYADILLHMIDASHPAALQQARTTFQVLQELGAEDRPMIHVLNKIDRLTDPAKLQQFRVLYPHVVEISALQQIGIPPLIQKMTQLLQERRAIVHMRIPQSHYAVVSDIMRLGRIIKVEYEENDVLITVELTHSLIGKYHEYLQTP